MIIFLVGYMGCGKSTIGRALARRLKMDFLDMDPLIEQHCGKSIRDIFAAEGEEGFRLHEKEDNKIASSLPEEVLPVFLTIWMS